MYTRYPGRPSSEVTRRSALEGPNRRSLDAVLDAQLLHFPNFLLAKHFQLRLKGPSTIVAQG